MEKKRNETKRKTKIKLYNFPQRLLHAKINWKLFAMHIFPVCTYCWNDNLFAFFFSLFLCFFFFFCTIFPFHSVFAINARFILKRCNNSWVTAIIASFPPDDFFLFYYNFNCTGARTHKTPDARSSSCIQHPATSSIRHVWVLQLANLLMYIRLIIRINFDKKKMLHENQCERRLLTVMRVSANGGGGTGGSNDDDDDDGINSPCRKLINFQIENYNTEMR